MKKYYVNINDFQGGNWAFGVVETIKGWQDLAISWCESDENYDLLKVIKTHKLNTDLLDLISEIWTIEIVEFNNENINKILENYDKVDLGWLLKYLVEKVGKQI